MTDKGRDDPPGPLDHDTQLRVLPPPKDEEVEALLRKVALRVVALLRRKGKLEEALRGEDALDFLRAEAVRSPRLPLGLAKQSPRRGRRCAFLEGFSLHANTWVHENDRVGLVRLCNYGARGPLSLERLSLLPDGKVSYRMKRPAASGATELVLSPVAFLRRLAALVPPPGVHLSPPRPLLRRPGAQRAPPPAGGPRPPAHHCSTPSPCSATVRYRLWALAAPRAMEAIRPPVSSQSVAPPALRRGLSVRPS